MTDENPEDVVRRILVMDDEVERIDSMTKEELESALRSAGADAGEMRARANRDLERILAAHAPVIPLHRRRVLRFSLAAAALVAAALAAMPVIETIAESPSPRASPRDKGQHELRVARVPEDPGRAGQQALPATAPDGGTR
jgi:hypothetical protein